MAEASAFCARMLADNLSDSNSSALLHHRQSLVNDEEADS
jgi:hypothetical protein